MVKTKMQELMSFFMALKTYWNIPKKGRHMPYKEITFYSVGAMGITILYTYVGPMIVTSTNVLIGNVIGVEPTHMFYINALIVFASYPLTFLRAKIIDGSRSLKGKYRPYILTMAVPTVLFAIAMVWTPYDSMSYFMMCALITFYGCGLSFFYGFITEIKTNYIAVLSPNSQERADVTAINSIVGSLAPSIINILIPILAQYLLGITSLLDIRVYRYIYPPFLILSIALAAFMYVGTKEKIIQAKTHVIKIKFMDALKAVTKNKYFWIISLASWAGFLEGAAVNIMSWYQSYQGAVTPSVYSIIITLYGNASFWGMLFAPIAIRRFGKRAIMIATNIANIILIGSMYPVVGTFEPEKAIWIVLIFMFSNACVSAAVTHVVSPSIQGDMRDYQQYITGERIDGMFSAVSLIGSTIGLVTSGVLPWIYEKVGLNSAVAESLGYTNVYDVLYEYEYFVSITRVLIVAAVIGAAMNVIPLFFYDLTETKQKGIVAVLKLRALFEDYGNDALDDKEIVEAIELINEASEFHNQENKPISKKTDNLDKKTIKENKAFNEQVFISNMLMQELNKFDDPAVQVELSRAFEIRAAGLEDLINFDVNELAKAKAMPKNTTDEKAVRKVAVAYAKGRINSVKAIKKYYPNGLVKFDRVVFDGLFTRDDELALFVRETQDKLVAAKNAKDTAEIATQNEILKGYRAEQKKIKFAIKKNTDEYSNYNRSAAPYLEAKKLIIQSENYKHFDEIEARYEAAKEQTQAEYARAMAQQQQKSDDKKLAKETKKENKKENKKNKKD
ncbi:MAG: MFS transporter [Clostridia bacterium]